MPSIADRVRETTTTTGTGTVNLEGAVTGFQLFSAAFSTGTVVYYCISDGTNWEIGYGAVTTGSPWTLARTVVLQSTNADALVDFAAGSKDVFCTMPAQAFIAANIVNTPAGNIVGTTVQAAIDELDTEKAVDAVVSKIGKQTIWLPAGAMTSRTTSGAASGSVETTTNKVMLKSLDFDTATSEYAQFAIQMPKSWNEGTITARFVWSHAATTTNFGVAWALQGVALSDTDAGDAAFGTAILVTDTGGTTNSIYVSADTAAVTIAGTPAVQDWVVFQVYRAVADAGDTMAIDARLHGVQLFYTTDAANDA